MKYNNFVKHCLLNGGALFPLNIQSNDSKNTGICNPSIFIEDDGRVRLILRNVNYMLWNCDNEYKFTTPYGPLCYITRDNDSHLRTTNFLCELDNNNLLTYKTVNMTYDKEPIWDFVGLEDARLVRWDGKLYLTGVRRDTTENGQGRMELSEITEDGVEISRVRLKAPGDDSSYCEKNWMPILDKPYHYVRWCNPLEIVKVDPNTGDTEVVLSKEVPSDIENLNTDNMSIRGSSQVVRCDDYYMAITHMCRLWFNEKGQKSGAEYFEQFIIWDDEWNVVKISKPFKFANCSIEFTNGLAVKDDIVYMPFAVQDGITFMIVSNKKSVMDFIMSDRMSDDNFQSDNNLISFFNNTTDSYNCFKLANDYYLDGHYAASMILSERACEYNTFRNFDDLYVCMFLCGASLANVPGTDIHEKAIWLRMIDLLPNRSEAYYMLSRYYLARNLYQEAYTFSRLGRIKNCYKFDESVINRYDVDINYIKALYNTENYLDCDALIDNLLNNDGVSEAQKETLNEISAIIEKNKQNKTRVL